MLKHKATRCLLVPVAFIALLFLTITLGNVRHHHAGSSKASCSICHVNHQPLERPLSSDSTPALAQLGSQPEPLECAVAPTLLTPRLPARAPPTA